VLTDAGRWAHDVLSFLHRRLRESELLPTVAGVRYALDIGLDPLRHLQSMRSRLVALREEIDAAMASHSEVVLRRTAEKLSEALALSERIRLVLDAVRLDQVAARRVAREIHELLSRLHGAGAELHAAITEVGRQYLRLTAGLTVEQIVRALMDQRLEELAEVGRSALFPALAPPPLLTTEAVAHAAEIQALRDRPAATAVVWSEPEEAPRAAGGLDAPPEVARLLPARPLPARRLRARPLPPPHPRARPLPARRLRARPLPPPHPGARPLPARPLPAPRSPAGRRSRTRGDSAPGSARRASCGPRWPWAAPRSLPAARLRAPRPVRWRRRLASHAGWPAR